MSDLVVPQIKPVRNHILVRIRPTEKKSTIITPSSAKVTVPPYLVGEVLATGPGLKSPQTGEPTKCVCDAGDMVALRPVTAIPVDGGEPMGKTRLDTIRYFLMEDDAVVGILPPGTAPNAG